MNGKRLLILSTTTGYQTRSFVEAAEKLGLGVVFGTDRCHVLEDPWRDGALPLRFENPEDSARQVVEYARTNPVHAVVALGDRPVPTAARACQALGLLFHPPEAADACRDKSLARERLRAAGLKVPAFARFPLDADPGALLAFASAPAGTGFPCVLKPLALSASRGVIRANDAAEFIGAFNRIRDLLRTPEVQVMREKTSDFIQVESYVEGEEIAVEGLMDRGRLRVLAIFDKPDPLVGPFFEETIYVTPSRLAPQVQTEVTDTLEEAVRALGLFHGPLHAELRINADGLPAQAGIWILEIAARAIGGLCSRALRFDFAHRPERVEGRFTRGAAGDHMSLEELLIRLALGEDVGGVRRENAAAGVMMIPVPQAGIFQAVDGVEQALETPGVEEVRITAKPNESLTPLPEGSSYPGFIFARGATPQFIEQALRRAYEKLRFVIAPALPVV